MNHSSLKDRLSWKVQEAVAGLCQESPVCPWASSYASLGSSLHPVYRDHNPVKLSGFVLIYLRRGRQKRYRARWKPGVRKSSQINRMESRDLAT